MLVLLFLLRLSEPSLAAAPSPAEQISARFVQALRSGDVRALTAPPVKEGATAGVLNTLRGMLEPYDCVSIPTYQVRVEKATDADLELTVTVTASAFSYGTPRAQMPYPRDWRLGAVRTPNGWQLQSVLTGEQLIARRLVALPEISEERILAETGDADLERVLLLYLNDPEISTDPAKGIAIMKFVGEMARRRGLTMVEIVAVREQALVAAAAGQTDRVKELGERTMELARASGLPDAQATVLLTVGLFDWQAGRFDAALDHYAESAAFMDAVQDPRAAMKSLYMRALLLKNRGRYREVALAAATLGDAAERFAWTEGVCLTAFLRNDLFSVLQDLPMSRHFAVDALRCAQRIDNEEFIAIATSNLATSEQDIGNRTAAAELMQKLIDTPRSDADRTALATMHSILASMRAEDGRLKEAEAEYQIAIRMLRETEEKLLEANVLDGLARVQLQDHRPEEALRTAEEGDALLRKFAATVKLYQDNSAWAIRGTLGSALRAVGRDEEAVLALQSSIELIESTRDNVGSDEVGLAGFMRDKANSYREMLSLLVERGQPRDALIVSERFRARSLGSAAARGHIDRLASMSDADRKQADAYDESIADLNRKLFASRDDAADAALREQLTQVRFQQRTFLSGIYASSAGLRHRNLDDPRIVLADGARVLPNRDEAMLSFSVHDDETFVFYIGRGSDLDIAVQRIPIRKSELEERVRHFLGEIERRDLGYRHSARSLYDLLLAPFAARLVGKRLLYVVPDGMLWRLPFQALQRPDGQSLVEVVALAYTPSVTLLRNRRSDPGANTRARTVLAIADPGIAGSTVRALEAVHRDAELAPLPDARTEAREIQRTYGANSRVLIGAEATETAVKKLAPQFRILHVATHGILDDASPMVSSLVLAQTDDDDGLLEAREMMDLDLGADLAVLSACETAGGDVSPGEGIIGMSWALMVAGCRNTVVSQWKVESRSTAQLMIDFHRRANRSGADYASALQRAQRELMRKPEFSHPHYWAPFILVATSQ